MSEKEVEAVIEEMTGICPTENADGLNAGIYQALSAAIIGQDKAVMALSDAVTRSLAGINAPDRPRGIFLFIGESGVGKTALAKELSMFLFRNKDALVRYDMSEFSESYSVSKLIGSAPGYVGYEDANSALERIRRHPYSVILLDEIEKAHPDVLALFLQVFDNGYLCDASGKKISFRNTYVIMTSNVGADSSSGTKSIGFIEKSHAEKVERLKRYFKAEFINRIDEIIPFSPLGIESLTAIAKNMLSLLRGRLNESGISLQIGDEVYEYIARKGKQYGSGARVLDRMITVEIENKVAKMIVSREIGFGDSVKVALSEGAVVCKKVVPALAASAPLND